MMVHKLTLIFVFAHKLWRNKLPLPFLLVIKIKIIEMLWSVAQKHKSLTGFIGLHFFPFLLLRQNLYYETFYLGTDH